MSKAFLVASLVTGPPGTGFSSINRFFSDEASAKAHVQESQAAIQLLATGKIVVKTDKGPQVMCTVQEFLQKLGITGIAFEAKGGEMTGSVVVPDGPKIILASN